MKVAIITRKETMDKCTGKGCMRAFFNKEDAFEGYPADTELVAFTHDGGDLEHKISRLKEMDVDTVHLSTCMRGKSDRYEELAYQLSRDFEVKGYTHGGKDGKNRKSINLKKQL